ncbi:MAG TPA: lipoyl(octanoyl) transferase LipB, partial [Planctomycetota bacterium]|nr:lipoyl(octanoyl) transferase LipB [Planctomycetota bacterium]
GLDVRDLGRMPYRLAWALQKELVEARLAGRACDTLLLVEHDPVVTLGRGTRGEFLAGGARVLREGDAEFVPLPGGARAEVIEVERGGQATYHGPGQLIAYPIVKLREDRHDLHAWMRALEQAVIDALAPLGLRAGRREGATGVWIDGQRKICSIGVAASRWVTYHGLALNVDTELAHFMAIAPCGFEAGVMTSVERETGGASTQDFPTRLAECLGASCDMFREGR